METHIKGSCLYKRVGAKKDEILITRLEPENANDKFAVVKEKKGECLEHSIPSFKSN